MNLQKNILCFYFLLVSFSVVAQQNENWRWIQPSDIHGQLTDDGISRYGRLPDDLREIVRAPVWNLGTNSAGLYIDFTSDTDSIQVRYKVKGPLNMPHMPTVGVSGLDLYILDPAAKEWAWTAGKYAFKDTISYTFTHMGSSLHRTYRLYLPLYNTVEWLEIGVPAGAVLETKAVDNTKKPIIVYGTSIAQGACASRPGLAWTNMLNRAVGRPIINLAFSGNGRLEQPILELIAKEEASTIILDCLPNLGVGTQRTAEQVDSLIYHAVTFLRKAQPHTPIILTEHSAGFDSFVLQEEVNRAAEQSTKIARATFKRLEKEGVKGIYLLTNRAIEMDLNSTVDYVHPNDIGMMKIAKAYAALLKRIL